MKNILPIVVLLFISIQISAQKNKTIYLWPGQVPGESEAKQDPVQTDNTSGNVTRITDITNPALIVYEAEASKRNGARVIDVLGEDIVFWLWTKKVMKLQSG